MFFIIIYATALTDGRVACGKLSCLSYVHKIHFSRKQVKRPHNLVSEIMSGRVVCTLPSFGWFLEWARGNNRPFIWIAPFQKSG